MALDMPPHKTKLSPQRPSCQFSCSKKGCDRPLSQAHGNGLLKALGKKIGAVNPPLLFPTLTLIFYLALLAWICPTASSADFVAGSV